MSMNPVGGGWTSHVTRGDGDYESKKRAALAQSKLIDYEQGIFDGKRDAAAVGPGQNIADTRSKYGNVNIMPQDVLLGANSNFAQRDVPGNMALDDPINQTGSQQLKTSATKTPNVDPQQFETAALDARLAKMAKGGMNNLNNINEVYNV